MSLIANDLTCVYGIGTPNETKALVNINLSVDKGEYVCLVGHTGSGKSTLACHLNMLMLPTEGHIEIDGVIVAEKNTNIRSLRKKVGLVFQYPEQQFFSETVFDEIAFAPRAWGESEQEVEDAVIYAAEAVGLKKDLLTANPFALSGGEQRRVALASVLSVRPEYLILDEPMAGLDIDGILHLKDLLARLKSDGTGILHITHDLESALELSDKIVILEDGKEIFTGKAEAAAEFILDGDVQGLVIPPIVEFCCALRKKGLEIPLVSDVENIIDVIEKEKKRRRRG